MVYRQAWTPPACTSSSTAAPTPAAGLRISASSIHCGLAERSIRVQAFDDLDSHPELVLGAGHVERDGVVVLIKRSVPAAAAAPSRSQASRADHADDERVVFPKSSGTPL